MGILGGARGNESIYDDLPPPGGFTAAHPACVYNNSGVTVEVRFGKGGKKIIKKVKTNKNEERRITKEEAMDNPDKMFKYLKQFNKREDEAWEKKELAAYVDKDEF